MQCGICQRGVVCGRYYKYTVLSVYAWMDAIAEGFAPVIHCDIFICRRIQTSKETFVVKAHSLSAAPVSVS